MLFLVCRQIRLRSRFNQRLRHHTVLHGIAVFTVIHQTDSVAALGDIRPFVAAHFESCLIPACIGVQFSCHITKLDIVDRLITVDIYREMNLQYMFGKLPVNIGFKINSAVFCIKMNLLADDGIHHLALNLQRCTNRTVFCPLHAAYSFHLPGFLGVEDIQVPCAVLQWFILIDPQLVAGRSVLKNFAVVFFIKQGGKFAVCIDCDGVEWCLKDISFSCCCYTKWCLCSSSACRTQYLISFRRQIFYIKNGSLFCLLYRIYVCSICHGFRPGLTKHNDIVSSVSQRVPYGYTLILCITEGFQPLANQLL